MTRPPLTVRGGGGAVTLTVPLPARPGGSGPEAGIVDHARGRGLGGRAGLANDGPGVDGVGERPGSGRVAGKPVPLSSGVRVSVPPPPSTVRVDPRPSRMPAEPTLKVSLPRPP